ncbi:MAG: FtsH protease activity modulator HflK [Alphaproteobacteria bacterium]|nr:FtsH protease activity modulator HflK [Alphaproteobacteria bacterium]
MAWTPHGGGNGPWGNGQGPWGRGGGGQQPPDIEDLLRKGQERIRRAIPGGFGGGKAFGLLLVVAVGLWFLTGFYRVGPDEQGVVLRFGKWVDTTGPGLHYHLPTPIESVLKPRVTRINTVELGFRSIGGQRGAADTPTRDVSEESLMLTGDENIVDIDFAVFWQIKDAGQYLFNIRDPEGTVKVASESAMRDIIGQTPIHIALTEGRARIAIAARDLLQGLLDSYGAGIRVTQVQLLKVDPPGVVVDAFNDVQRAKADQERLRNEAEAYANDVLPRARGESVRLQQEAEAYKEQVVNLAQGDANRFLSVLESYRLSKDVTTRRLYLETMEDVLRRANKIIIDPGAEGAQGVVPYLPLPELRNGAKTQAATQQQQGGGQ